MRWARQTSGESKTARLRGHRSLLALAASAMILVMGLTASLEAASATSLEPSRPGANPPAATATRRDTITNSDIDTLGPGPADISATSQDSDVDCSGRQALTAQVQAEESSPSQVVCGSGGP
jgi:hypothetical protein